jgi:excisionase family DNA binding protein
MQTEDNDVTAEEAHEWLSVSQVARRLGYSNLWVRRLADRGKLRSRRTALGRLVDPLSVTEVLRARAGPEPEISSSDLASAHREAPRRDGLDGRTDGG